MKYSFNEIMTGYSSFVSKNDLVKEENSPALSKVVKESVNNIKQYDNWYKYQDDLYYLKYPSFLKNFLVELIGVEISRYMELPTIEYKIVSYNDNVVGLLSKNFKKEDKFYRKSSHLSKDEVLSINRMLFDGSDKSFDKKMFTMCLFRNYFTCLHDRAANSLIIDNLDGTFSLPELYDYELEFGSPYEMVYNDPMFILGSWYKPLYTEIDELQKENIFVDDALSKIKDLNILDIIKLVEDKHTICVPKAYKDSFEEYVLERKKVLKKAKILK